MSRSAIVNAADMRLQHRVAARRYIDIDAVLQDSHIAADRSCVVFHQQHAEWWVAGSSAARASLRASCPISFGIVQDIEILAPPKGESPISTVPPCQRAICLTMASQCRSHRNPGPGFRPTAQKAEQPFAFGHRDPGASSTHNSRLPSRSVTLDVHYALRVVHRIATGCPPHVEVAVIALHRGGQPSMKCATRGTPARASSRASSVNSFSQVAVSMLVISRCGDRDPAVHIPEASRQIVELVDGTGHRGKLPVLSRPSGRQRQFVTEPETHDRRGIRATPRWSIRHET